MSCTEDIMTDDVPENSGVQFIDIYEWLAMAFYTDLVAKIIADMAAEYIMQNMDIDEALQEIMTADDYQMCCLKYMNEQ